MNSYITYIIYSESIGRYYVGSTLMTLEDRLQRHNSNHKGFTGRANDWVVVHKCVFKDVSSSRQLEAKIKKRGPKRYIDDLA
ncbi:MAG: putative endonuclease [Saprospiraceae bacterium]|jgi:putative endonuclease